MKPIYSDVNKRSSDKIKDKSAAKEVNALLDMKPIYYGIKNEKRLKYENDLKSLDKKLFQKYIKKYVKLMNDHVNFEIDLDSMDKRRAFQQAVRIFNRNSDDSFRPVMYAIDAEGHNKIYTIGKNVFANRQKVDNKFIRRSILEFAN